MAVNYSYLSLHGVPTWPLRWQRETGCLATSHLHGLPNQQGQDPFRVVGEPQCAVLCCAVLCCAVLCCAVLCCAVLCCAVPKGSLRYGENHTDTVWLSARQKENPFFSCLVSVFSLQDLLCFESGCWCGAIGNISCFKCSFSCFRILCPCQGKKEPRFEKKRRKI